MNNTTKTILGIIALIIIILLVRGISGGKTITPEGPIKIGFIGPLSGEAAAYGESMKQGVELAVKELGSNVEVIYEDGKCNGKDAVSAVQKLINIDKVKFIVGAGCSGETMAIAPIVEESQVLALSPVSSNAAITTMGDYIFRNHPSDNEAGKEISKFIYQKTQTTAIISEQTDYAQGIKKVFIEDFTKSGGKIIFDESFTSGTTDFRSMITKLKALNPEGIYVNAQTESSFLKIVGQMKELGLTTQIYSAYLTGEGIKKESKLLEGLVIVDLPAISNDGKSLDFKNKFKENFGKEPNYPYFAAASYDATNLLAEGIKKNGYDATKVKDYLYSIKNYSGAIGNYGFDNNGDVIGISLTMKNLVNGEFIEIK
jgi:branched-chain amino acid transport system substrate-binding protein